MLLSGSRRPGGTGQQRPAHRHRQAGGQSRRMGRDKATTLLNGKMMLTHLIEKLPPYLPIFLISNTPEKHAIFECPIVADVLPGKGAPGGIYTALHHSQTPWTLCLACDTPLLSSALLMYLLSQMEIDSDAAAIVPIVNERYQPLHVLYHQHCKTVFHDQLHNNEKVPAIRSLLDMLPLKTLNEQTLRQYDPDLRSFINVNTPDELRHVEKLLDASAGE
ncbi:MAG: molybdenum cofactor guanylyltransferase [Aggregatilineales bacterium]